MTFEETFRKADDEFERRQRKQEYITNPVAWAKDYLGIQLWSKQAEVAMSLVDNKNVVVKAGHEVGKALALNTPIPTPSGWTAMGDLFVGDEVYDENGAVCYVTAKSEVWNTDTYRLTFDDGHQIVTAGQHEWNVLDLQDRRTRFRHEPIHDWRSYWNRSTIVSTEQMFQDGTKNHLGQNRWRIPLSGALEGVSEDLPISPYVLGAWLGDGTSSAAGITIHPDDYEIIDQMISQGETVNRVPSSPYGWSLSSYISTGVRDASFIRRLRELNLVSNKHIPQAYLRAAYSDRLELLRGLMDTDGTIDKRGLTSFTSTSEVLARGVRELIESLGWKCSFRKSKAKLNGVVVSDVYDLSFRSDVVPFRLGRKITRWKPGAAQNSRYTIRTVVNIERVENQPTQCIEVDSASHLFLAGDGMIPTHNSFLAGLLICWWVDVHWELPGGCFVVSTAPSTKQINAVVWREVRKFWALGNERYNAGLVDHPLPGYITADAHWRLPSGIELGYGAKPPEGKSDSMSGIHARYVLSVGDEAVGLSEELIDDLGNITSNATSRRFLICNPTNPLSYVASIFRRNLDSWKQWTISVFDSPNFHGGEGLPIEARESLVDQSYVNDKIDEWGQEYTLDPAEDKDNPLLQFNGGYHSKSPKYVSRVLGEFAWDMGFTLIREADIAKGLDVEIEPSLETRPRLGVDFSRSKAGDKNTVYSWHDGKLRKVAAWNEADAMVTARKVNELALSLGVEYVHGDGQGLGGPILDRIAELSEGRYAVIPVDSNFASPDLMKWYNWRAYTYWDFQDRLSKREIDLDIEDEELQEELLGIELKKRLTGRDNILLESKEEMRKRGIHSPDHADAAVMAATDYSWVVGKKPVGTRVDLTPEIPEDDPLMELFYGAGAPW